MEKEDIVETKDSNIEIKKEDFEKLLKSFEDAVKDIVQYFKGYCLFYSKEVLNEKELFERVFIDDHLFSSKIKNSKLLSFYGDDLRDYIYIYITLYYVPFCPVIEFFLDIHFKVMNNPKVYSKITMFDEFGNIRYEFFEKYISNYFKHYFPDILKFYNVNGYKTKNNLPLKIYIMNMYQFSGSFIIDFMIFINFYDIFNEKELMFNFIINSYLKTSPLQQNKNFSDFDLSSGIRNINGNYFTFNDNSENKIFVNSAFIPNPQNKLDIKKIMNETENKYQEIRKWLNKNLLSFHEKSLSIKEKFLKINSICPNLINSNTGIINKKILRVFIANYKISEIKTLKISDEIPVLQQIEIC